MPTPVRYVQYFRFEDCFAAECVAPQYWPSTPAQQRAILLRGWNAPRKAPGYPSDNFARLLAAGDPGTAAALGVDALAVLGCDPDVAWEWTQIRA